MPSYSMDFSPLRKPGVRYRSLSFMGFPNYRVGTDGSMYSLGRWKKGWGRMRLVRNGDYLKVGLYGETSLVTYVSRIVLLAFVGPCPDGMECCHNDGNPLNNDLSNLRWDTHKNNAADTVRHGNSLRGEKNGNAKLSDEQVVKLWDLREKGWKKTPLALYFGVSRSLVDQILKGEVRKHLFRNLPHRSDRGRCVMATLTTTIANKNPLERK